MWFSTNVSHVQRCFFIEQQHITLSHWAELYHGPYTLNLTYLKLTGNHNQVFLSDTMSVNKISTQAKLWKIKDACHFCIDIFLNVVWKITPLHPSVIAQVCRRGFHRSTLYSVYMSGLSPILLSQVSRLCVTICCTRIDPSRRPNSSDHTVHHNHSKRKSAFRGEGSVNWTEVQEKCWHDIASHTAVTAAFSGWSICVTWWLLLVWPSLFMRLDAGVFQPVVMWCERAT